VAIQRIGSDLVFATASEKSGIADVLRSVIKECRYEFGLLLNELSIYLSDRVASVCLQLNH
jgi:hypothetical protein